jgi:predicted transcriptional regulator
MAGRTYEGRVRHSYNRSLKRLMEWGLVTRTAKKSPGRHGYLYRLTDAGREKAKKIRGEIVAYITEYRKYL